MPPTLVQFVAEVHQVRLLRLGNINLLGAFYIATNVKVFTLPTDFQFSITSIILIACKKGP